MFIFLVVIINNGHVAITLCESEYLMVSFPLSLSNRTASVLQ